MDTDQEPAEEFTSEKTITKLFEQFHVKNLSELEATVELIYPIVTNAIKLERWFDSTPISIQCKNSKDTMRANAILAALSVSVNDYIDKTKKFNEPEYIIPTIISEEEAKKMLSDTKKENE